MSDSPHTPVLAKEVVELLQPISPGIYVDGTLGAGGHTRLLLEHSAPLGQVIAIDRDANAIAIAKERLGTLATRIRFVHGSFEDIDAHLGALDIHEVDGLLLDLGVSSMQLDTRERGFSFIRDGPIDMRMDSSCGETALELIERLSQQELADVLKDYGEERYSWRISQRLKTDAMKGGLTSTLALADAIGHCIPNANKRASRIHPATRSFQALRIAVNQELDQLGKFLEKFPNILSPGGRCAIISFHSLEDRMVKQKFRALAKVSNLPPNLARRAGEPVHPTCLPLHKKPILAQEHETQINPRARSAKLRGCEKVVA